MTGTFEQTQVKQTQNFCPVPGASPIVRVRGLTVLRGSRAVLSDLSLDVCAGEVVVLAGENGCGKSTLIRAVLGELASDSGSIELFGTPARTFSDWDRVGYLQQLPPTSSVRFPATAYELVRACCPRPGLGRGLDPGRNRVQNQDRAGQQPHKQLLSSPRQRALECLELVGIKDLAHRPISRMSGGQLQRVRLAAALACDPELLILDEPTTGLDRDTSRGLCGLIHSMAHPQTGPARTVLMVSHDESVLGIPCARVLTLSNGKVA